MSNEHPMEYRNGGSTSKGVAFSFGKMASPINVQVKIPDNVNRVFGKYPIVPYAGSAHFNQHGFLKFLNALPVLSPTYGACKQSINTHIFSGPLGYFDNKSKDGISDDDKQYINDIIGTTGIDPKEFGSQLDDDNRDNGNMFVEVILIESLGVRSFKSNVLESEHCYPMTNGQYLITPVLDMDFMNKYPPKVLPLFPEFTKEGSEKGVRRSLMHFKNGSLWWGRPTNLAAHMAGFREWQDLDYRAKISDRQFMGQVFMEMSKSDPKQSSPFKGIQDKNKDKAVREKAPAKSALQSMKEAFTVEGDNPSSIVLSEKPNGVDPTLIHEFKIHTNESYFKFEDDTSRRNIFENFGWSERLLGAAVPNGLTSNAYIDELKIKDIGVLSQSREQYQMVINKIYQLAGLYLGIPVSDSVGVCFKSSVEMLESRDEKLKSLTMAMKTYFDGVRFGVITNNPELEANFAQKMLEWTQ